MQHTLTEKLKSYITINHPDLLIELQDKYSLRQYLEDKVSTIMPYVGQLLAEQKPQYIIEELCMNRLTEDLRPSKYNYLYAVLTEEFEDRFAAFTKSGILTYELLNILDECKPVFEKHDFSEATENNRMLRYEITGKMLEYLNSN